MKSTLSKLMRLYSLWKADRGMLFLFRVWMYLYDNGTFTAAQDEGDYFAYKLVEDILHQMLEERKTI